jgi:hypothetical protein
MKELRKYLTINSIFSAVCGLIMLMLSGGLNQLFGIENFYIFPVLGLNLLVFAVFVWYVSRNQLTNRAWVMTITVLDVLWVVGSFVIVLLGLFDLTGSGYILTAVVALWIAFLAYKQFVNSGRT